MTHPSQKKLYETRASPHVAAVLDIRRCGQGGPNGAPLTLFMDRVWALQGLWLFLSEEYYHKLWV